MTDSPPWGAAAASAIHDEAPSGSLALISSRLRPGRPPRPALLALAGFLAITFVPGLKYPANPPSVGDPATIGYRTQLFFAMISLSIAATVGAASLGLRLRRRLGVWNATLVAGGTFIAVMIGVQLLLPDVDEVPEMFPAVVLWRFRESALGIHAVLWTSIGLIFGWLTERSLSKRFGLKRHALS